MTTKCTVQQVTEKGIVIYCPTDAEAGKITSYIDKHLPTWNFKTEYGVDNTVKVNVWRQKPQTGRQVKDILYIHNLIRK